MKKFHVEILTPVEIIADNIPGRSGRDAIERVCKSAGFTGLRYMWTQGTGTTYPPGKRPACPVFRDQNGEFIHTIAWTE